MLYGWKENSMLTNCLAACAHLTITVSEIERDIGRKSSFFIPPLHSTPPLGGFPSEYHHPVWCGKYHRYEMWAEVVQSRKTFEFLVYTCPKGVYPLKRFLKNLAWGGSPRSATSRQILPLWVNKCGLTGQKIAKNAVRFPMPNFTFIGATCRPCGAKTPFLDHWVKISAVLPVMTLIINCSTYCVRCKVASRCFFLSIRKLLLTTEILEL